jgi:hypothetical protein
MFKFIFQRISCSEIFFDFCENKKSARKVSSMHGCFENSKYAVGKIEKVEKSKMVESEYGIRTDLPSARARRLESNERDLSPAVITTVRLVLENWMRTNLRPYTTPSLHIFSWIMWL